jgi:hypothetical protein
LINTLALPFLVDKSISLFLTPGEPTFRPLEALRLRRTMLRVKDKERELSSVWLMKERIKNLETKLYERNRQHEALEKKAAVHVCNN